MDQSKELILPCVQDFFKATLSCFPLCCWSHGSILLLSTKRKKIIIKEMNKIKGAECGHHLNNYLFI